MNRREFLTKTGLATAAGLALPGPTSCLTPTQARFRRPTSSGRVNLGVIGYTASN